ncbi:hypothetical protein B0J14DRAFT_570713 [Halenospora varia]|nr:hypothetical protein B0J14DRAFT_570713 [Halenospora varia]
MSQPPIEFGFMLLAAYMLNDSERFMEISGAALRELTPGFSAEWENEEILTILAASIPSELRQSSAMSICIKRTLGELEAELQSVDLLLRQSSKCYKTSQLICIDCGENAPRTGKEVPSMP